jgi:serine protease AprX
VSRERYKVRFPDRDSFVAGQATEAVSLDVRLTNEKRAFIAVEPPGVSRQEAFRGVEAFGAEAAPAVDMDRELTMLEREYGAEVVVDYQYALEETAPDDFELPVGPEVADSESLDDVLRQIAATEAWQTTRGAGVRIAIVDTGVNGDRSEFGPARRAGGWAPAGEDPWTDYKGHGTMCGCIAAASREDGGEFDGVAPQASLISCRTRFLDSELATLYDYLTELAEVEGAAPIVASNSFGVRTGVAPAEDPDSDFIPALGDALAAGIAVCFSAGNYHELVGGEAAACGPTSIWGYKCRNDVTAVAASRPDGTMWSYSSRGPGQHAGKEGMGDKPDITAPTPPDGRVLYGDGPRNLPDGWGTSGACPQVAGLLALLLSAGHSRADAIAAMYKSATPLGVGAPCQGAGVIDCSKALAQLKP